MGIFVVGVQYIVLNHIDKWTYVCSPFICILFVRDDAQKHLKQRAPGQVDTNTTNTTKYNKYYIWCTMTEVIMDMDMDRKSCRNITVIIYQCSLTLLTFLASWHKGNSPKLLLLNALANIKCSEAWASVQLRDFWDLTDEAWEGGHISEPTVLICLLKFLITVTTNLHLVVTAPHPICLLSPSILSPVHLLKSLTPQETETRRRRRRRRVISVNIWVHLVSFPMFPYCVSLVFLVCICWFLQCRYVNVGGHSSLWIMFLWT